MINIFLPVLVSSVFFIESPVPPRNVQHLLIVLSASHQHMENLTTVVDTKVTTKLPKLFFVVLNGWSVGLTHYAGLIEFCENESNNCV